VTRLKAFVTNPVERSSSDALPFYALEQIDSGVGRLRPDADIEASIDDTAVAHQPGDVRFGKLRPYLAKSLLMTDTGRGSAELLVLRPRPAVMDSRYLHYLTLSTAFVEWATATSYGVKMPRTCWDSIGRFDCDPPTLGEHRRIADYLDADTAYIDELIVEQENLVVLFLERREAELNGWIEHGGCQTALHEVSSPWVDAASPGWELTPLKHCAARVMVGIVINPSAYYEAEGVPALRGLNIRPGRVSSSDLVYMSHGSLANCTASRSFTRETSWSYERESLAPRRRCRHGPSAEMQSTSSSFDQVIGSFRASWSTHSTRESSSVRFITAQWGPSSLISIPPRWLTSWYRFLLSANNSGCWSICGLRWVVTTRWSQRPARRSTSFVSTARPSSPTP